MSLNTICIELFDYVEENCYLCLDYYNRFGQTHNHHDKNKSVAYRQIYVHCNIRCRMLGY